jgi:hypothetical protein
MGPTPPRVFSVRVANKGVMVDARQFDVKSGQGTCGRMVDSRRSKVERAGKKITQRRRVHRGFAEGLGRWGRLARAKAFEAPFAARDKQGEHEEW